MSTRAIIRIESEEPDFKNRSIYCHGDGYPEFLGRFLVGLVARLPMMDVNHPVRKPGGKLYWKASVFQALDRNPYLFCPNASYEPDKIACVIIGELWRMQYLGTYLTDRIPEEEIEKDWTDIEHVYVIKTPRYLSQGKPTLTWKELKDGEKKQYYEEHSMGELIQAIREERKRR